MRRNKNLVLAFCSIVLMMVAVLYTWSIIANYLEVNNGWTRFQTSVVFTTSICFYCVGSFLNSKADNLLSYRKRMVIIAGLISVGYLTIGLFDSFFFVMIGYGIFCSSGVGFAYNMLLSYCSHFFRDKIGYCNGVMLFCYGFATFPISFVTNRLLGNFGWRVTMFSLSIAEGIILSCSSFFLQPKFYGSSWDSNKPNTENHKHLSAGLFRNKTFWRLFFWLMILSSCALISIGSIKQMAVQVGYDDEISSMMPAIVSGAGCLGRICFGWLFDKEKKNNTVIVDSLFVVFSMVAFLFSFIKVSRVLFLMGTILLGIGYGGMATLCASITKDLFGDLHYSSNLSIITLQMIPASILGSLLGGYIYEAFGNYLVVYGILCLFMMVDFVLCINYFGSKNSKNKEVSTNY